METIGNFLDQPVTLIFRATGGSWCLWKEYLGSEGLEQE